eukprot:82546-Rhodomonas_salina.5
MEGWRDGWEGGRRRREIECGDGGIVKRRERRKGKRKICERGKEEKENLKEKEGKGKRGKKGKREKEKRERGKEGKRGRGKEGKREREKESGLTVWCGATKPRLRWLTEEEWREKKELMRKGKLAVLPGSYDRDQLVRELHDSRSTLFPHSLPNLPPHSFYTLVPTSLPTLSSQPCFFSSLSSPRACLLLSSLVVRCQRIGLKLDLSLSLSLSEFELVVVLRVARLRAMELRNDTTEAFVVSADHIRELDFWFNDEFDLEGTPGA